MVIGLPSPTEALVYWLSSPRSKGDNIINRKSEIGLMDFIVIGSSTSPSPSSKKGFGIYVVALKNFGMQVIAVICPMLLITGRGENELFNNKEIMHQQLVGHAMIHPSETTAKGPSWNDLFEPGLKQALFVGVGLQILQQDNAPL